MPQEDPDKASIVPAINANDFSVKVSLPVDYSLHMADKDICYLYWGVITHGHIEIDGNNIIASNPPKLKAAVPFDGPLTNHEWPLCAGELNAWYRIKDQANNWNHSLVHPVTVPLSNTLQPSISLPKPIVTAQDKTSYVSGAKVELPAFDKDTLKHAFTEGFTIQKGDKIKVHLASNSREILFSSSEYIAKSDGDSIPILIPASNLPTDQTIEIYYTIEREIPVQPHADYDSPPNMWQRFQSSITTVKLNTSIPTDLPEWDKEIVFDPPIFPGENIFGNLTKDSLTILNGNYIEIYIPRLPNEYTEALKAPTELKEGDEIRVHWYGCLGENISSFPPIPIPDTLKTTPHTISDTDQGQGYFLILLNQESLNKISLGSSLNYGISFYAVYRNQQCIGRSKQNGMGINLG